MNTTSTQTRPPSLNAVPRPTRRRFGRLVGATAVVLATAVGALSAPAGAMDDTSGDPQPIDRADLSVTALSVTDAQSAWSIRYTVANKGSKAAPSTTVGISGAGVAATRGVPALGIGASHTATFQVPITADCSVVVYATADSGRIVPEHNESNTRQAYGTRTTCPPRYRVTAYSFTAVDESGVDGSGSDEPFWTFNAVSTGGTATSTRSPVFGGVDTGETYWFWNQCIFGCSGATAGQLAPDGIGMSIQAWEKDLGNVDQIYYDIADAFVEAGAIVAGALGGVDSWVEKAITATGEGIDYILDWADNDLLGTNEFAYSPAYLAQALPSAGTAFHDTRTFGGPGTGATYTLQLTVQRLA